MLSEPARTSTPILGWSSPSNDQAQAQLLSFCFVEQCLMVYISLCAGAPAQGEVQMGPAPRRSLSRKRSEQSSPNR